MIAEWTRAAARLYAQMFGYFWLPCPVCGNYFGGQEWRDVDGHDAAIPDPEEGPGYGRGICPNCTRHGVGCHRRATMPGSTLLVRVGHGAHCLTE